ncbi:hypothetical protein K439DRAFT_1613585 [Ramaria rubella]|nr:hypothetical protein K439DRAFT_1613585 [Ramaria rubella]
MPLPFRLSTKQREFYEKSRTSVNVSVKSNFGASPLHLSALSKSWLRYLAPCQADPEPQFLGKRIPVIHGTYFWFAHNEGLLANNTNIHIGICDDADKGDLVTNLDAASLFLMLKSKEIIKVIQDRLGTLQFTVIEMSNLLISVDIYVIDPGTCMCFSYILFLKKIILSSGQEGQRLAASQPQYGYGDSRCQFAPACDTQYLYIFNKFSHFATIETNGKYLI